MTTITLDIETIPCQRADVRDYIAKSIKPPATFKKPESIAKWHEEEAPGAVDDAVAKTGLDGAFGQVVVIGYKFDAEPVTAIYSLEESELLEKFNNSLDCIPRSEWFTTCIVGHNVSSFDLRFLMQRYIVNGIKPHVILGRAASAKPWEADKVFDTMVQFAGVGNRISLDKLCLALSIPSSKGDMDGSMVGQAVADGRIVEVAEYCQRDVAATHACHSRMTFA
jgi:DNA polymerase elongation subunit (family B)